MWVYSRALPQFGYVMESSLPKMSVCGGSAKHMGPCVFGKCTKPNFMNNIQCSLNLSDSAFRKIIPLCNQNAYPEKNSEKSCPDIFKPVLLPMCIHFNTAVERRVYHMGGQNLASEHTMHELQCSRRQREHHGPGR